MLYIVPTPVGNLQDMTFRAIETLKSVDLILAEDTRTSGVLLQHYDIHTPLKSHHKFNEHETSADIVEPMPVLLPSATPVSSWCARLPKQMWRSSVFPVRRLLCRLW